MKSLLGLTLIVILSFPTAFAHSGRTDKCGGHHDRKRGGYHIHNKMKYCACYSDAAICKERTKGGRMK